MDFKDRPVSPAPSADIPGAISPGGASRRGKRASRARREGNGVSDKGAKDERRAGQGAKEKDVGSD